MTWRSAVLGFGTPSGSPGNCGSPLQGRCGMATSLEDLSKIGILLAGLLFSPGAFAQSSQSLYWQCVPASASDAQPKYCPVSNVYPLPNGPAINALAPVVGTQRGTAIASATGMTIPVGATVALVQFQGTNNGSGQCAFWQDDGTSPTGSAGQASPAYTPVWIAASAAFKAIAATGATCTMTVSYYK